jgi:hypothetical protein
MYIWEALSPGKSPFRKGGLFCLPAIKGTAQAPGSFSFLEEQVEQERSGVLGPSRHPDQAGVDFVRLNSGISIRPDRRGYSINTGL